MDSSIRTLPPVVEATDPQLQPAKSLLTRGLPKRPSPSTIHRWLKGLSGVRLPAVKIVGEWWTTEEAVNWFFEQRSLTAIQTQTRTQKVRDVSDEELRKIGLL
ncbi:hypothetical protein KOR42_46910 [Thalassoglobus neptunius]|uniref:Prophage CP4-57 regulatory protein (AlpA) n=1 Tax=Thalassoglobus neptunius TaxID=1938619 RepID=A0A5C5VY39_9PLAN|nr:hypothetical protein [Thalassoglobus neptunius]TWT42641.1 hypothetical protein KOR42_46910 [Thalassoglobus neptunius]